MARRPWHIFASAKRKQQKLVQLLQWQEQCIDHIPYYLYGLSHALFIFDNLSLNRCIYVCDIPPPPNSHVILRLSLQIKMKSYHIQCFQFGHHLNLKYNSVLCILIVAITMLQTKGFVQVNTFAKVQWIRHYEESTQANKSRHFTV